MANAYADTILGTSGLVRYFRLGESSGTVATDATGNDHGVYNGSPTLGVPGALAGDSDTAVAFGPSKWVGSIAMPAMTAWTIECWVYLTAAGSYPMFVTGVGGTTLNFRCDGASRTLQYVDTAGALGGVLTLNTWHYCVVTRVGTGVTIYLDGALAASGAGGLPPSWTAMEIGRRSDGFYLPAGSRIDEVAIYNRVLTAQEIADHYTAGITEIRTGPVLSSPHALNYLDPSAVLSSPYLIGSLR